MFTYREFADGAHRFRKRVISEFNQRKDLDYEVARSENELAVIHLSQNSDSVALAKILTYLPELMEELRTSERNEEQSLATLFTYYKLSGQAAQVAITPLDAEYCEVDNDYELSSGGLIYILRTEDQSLPDVRVKVPITASPGKVKTITHETFVAMVALNPLRSLIPSFSYVYSYWLCGGMIDASTEFSGLCVSPGPRPLMIYEMNPGAIPLSQKFRRDRKTMTLETILNYLLQLMGALEMANLYADYTHYDLHASNVLVQPLETAIRIEFLDYAVSTMERVIVIDNGLAFCSYERPDALAPLRRSRPRLRNADGIELFNLDSYNAERLQSSSLENYGSIQNRMLGVRYDRPYPLGDIFRIFFDMFSSSSERLRVEMLPLVGVFFKDIQQSLKMIGNQQHASSIVDTFSLPPFRPELYAYRYVDFAREILKLYPKVCSLFAKIREQDVFSRLRPARLFDYSVASSRLIPDLYQVGTIARIDELQAKLLSSELMQSQEFVLDDLRDQQEWLVEKLTDTPWFQDKVPESLDTEGIMDEVFYKYYVNNVRMCVNLNLLARIVYSNTTVLQDALRIRGVASPLRLLASTLGIDVKDLQSLATYCAAFPLPEVARRAVKALTKVTDIIEKIVSEFALTDHRVTYNTTRMNWYRACLPSVRIHLEFSAQWGNIPAFFGELSLPDGATDYS